MNREQWIRERAYRRWEFQTALGLPDNPVENWLEAENEWEWNQRNEKNFHSSYDLGNN